ncbi:MAG: class I SAM-dependent methyltransferase [bacterium]|nr:class I SAM-dependent methyltransferase [bacterium]MDZ4285680.1 class I SAM-dependent methyltransferase [Candidatus Sungbacteria bacterium]
MLIHELSLDEQETLATYECERIVEANSEVNFSVEYGVQEFAYFSHLLPLGRVLDLGCGSAPHARFFSQPDYEYVGIDMSVGMLRQAKEWEPDKMFFRMHMQSLSFRDGCFDGFWSFAALPHIPKQKIGGVLREIARVTRHGGIGCMLMVQGECEKMVEYDGTRALVAGYAREELKEIMGRSHLRTIECSEGECGDLLCIVEVDKK